ncbi:MAG: hypothetical protein DRG40_00405 [Deltaproteobacteria bacterium]|nr:MAG: hypothetical protein DRG40_00405 [Deltaproteobacteria bacterium]
MKKLWGISVAIGAMVAFLLAGSAHAGKVYKMRYSHGLPPQHYMAQIQAKWAKLVEEKSGGRIKIEVYPGGTLVNDKHLFEALSTGSVEVGGIYNFYLEPNVPEFAGLAPFGVAWNHDVNVAVSESFAKKKGPAWECAKAAEKKNLKVVAWLPWGEAGPRHGMAGTGKQIILPEDMKGRKIRPLGSLAPKVYKVYGGRPVYLSGAELYTALQRGTVDAVLICAAHMIQRKLVEVTDWYTGNFPWGTYVSTIICVNRDFYNELPPDLQRILFEAGEECRKEINETGYLLLNKFLEQTRKLVKVHILTREEQAKWTNAAAPFVVEFVKSKGPGCVRVYNEVQKIMKEFGLPYHFVQK